MQVPGLSVGVTFSDVFLALVAPDGTIVFTSQFSGSGVTSANDSAIWTWNNGNFTLIAREGDATPGAVGLQWSFFSPAAVSANGRLVFAARSTGSAGSDEALWMMTATGPKIMVRRWTPALGTFPPTFFGSPLTGFYVVSVNDDGDAIIGWEAGIYGWRENYGLFFVASDNASAFIDNVSHFLVTTFMPPRFDGITQAPNHSWNLRNDGAFVFQATYLEPPLNAWAFVRGTLPPLADLDGNACVDVLDLLTVINQWGPCTTTPCAGDCTHDGVVSVLDLLMVINQWGCD